MANFQQAKAPTAKRFCFANTSILTPDGNARRGVDVYVQNGSISDILPHNPAQSDTESLRIDASHYLVFPGLINAHTHAPLSYLKGVAHQTSHMIENLFFKTESKLSAELIEPLSYAYIYEGLRCGITTFADHYYFSGGVAKALDRIGLRGVIGECIADLGGAFPDAKRWLTAKQEIEHWQHSTRIRPLVAPHATDTVSAPLLTEMAAYAKANQLPLHMHLSQSKGERERVARRDQISPVAYADRCGAITPHSLLVHLVSADSRDLKIIAERGASVGFCPASQMIYERIAPFSEFLRLKIPVALATDCAPSNDGCDLYAELRLAGLMAKHFGCKEATPAELWKMVTRNPATALGIANVSTGIEVGVPADLVFIEDNLLAAPGHHILSDAIYGSTSRGITAVFVDQQFVLWQAKPCLVDEALMHSDFNDAVREILRRCNQSPKENA